MVGFILFSFYPCIENLYKKYRKVYILPKYALQLVGQAGILVIVVKEKTENNLIWRNLK